METKGIVGGSIGGLALIVFLVLVPGQCRVIGAGERGVVTTWGKVSEQVWDEGLHFKRLFSQKVYKVDVKILKAQEEVGAASKDLQETKAEVALNYHVSPTEANKIIQKIGRDYKSVVILPMIAEVTKATTAKYTAGELITSREEVRANIKATLKERLAAYYIIVDDFAIVNFSFSKQFEDAIEAKQTAQQNAQKAQQDLERIKIEAQQTIVSAQAEAASTVLNAKAQAESLALQRSVLTPELVNLRAIEKWNGALPTYTGGGAIPFISLK